MLVSLLVKITILGCGNAWSRKLGNTSFLVEQNNVKLVIDCGFTVPEAVEKITPLKSITHYFISHIHADHAGGLEEVAFKNYFISKHRPVLLVGEALAPSIWTNYLVSGLRNLLVEEEGQVKDLIATIDTYFYLYQMAPLKWVELKGSGLHLACYRTKHVGSKVNYSLLVRNEEKGTSALFTCDTVVESQLPYRSATLVFQDCSFTPTYPLTVHTHCSDLLALPKEIQEKVVCTHYGDDVTSKRPLLDQDIVPLRIGSPGDQFEV